MRTICNYFWILHEHQKNVLNRGQKNLRQKRMHIWGIDRSYWKLGENLLSGWGCSGKVPYLHGRHYFDWKLRVIAKYWLKSKQLLDFFWRFFAMACYEVTASLLFRNYPHTCPLHTVEKKDSKDNSYQAALVLFV